MKLAEYLWKWWKFELFMAAGNLALLLIASTLFGVLVFAGLTAYWLWDPVKDIVRGVKAKRKNRNTAKRRNARARKNSATRHGRGRDGFRDHDLE